MAKKNDDTGFWASMAETGLYKRNQGRLTRQLTAVSIGLIVFLGCWTLSRGPLVDYDNTWIEVGIPVVIGSLAAWMIYRTVNYPRFADFLISVEAEMDKVTWATKQDLYRSAAVVIGAMFFLGFVLFMFDLFWQWFFTLIGFLQLSQ